jgi:DNA-binding NarL/FixJ family response regulator
VLLNNVSVKKWVILVVDDVMVTREGVVAILNRIASIESVKVCENSTQALDEVRKVRPNLILINLELKRHNGILLGRQLIEVNSGLKVIVYSKAQPDVLVSEVYIKEHLNSSGIRHNFQLTLTGPTPGGNHTLTIPLSLHGYICLHNMTPKNLEGNLASLISQGGCIDPEIGRLLFERIKKYKLTPREVECAELISLGKSNQEVADDLGITRQAVENLMNNIYHKLSIKGQPKDPARRVLLALTIQRWKGLGKNKPD